MIVVDCAPTGETLRLLSFPEAARWWLGKLMGRETQLLAAARPLARAFLDLRLPDEDVMDEVRGSSRTSSRCTTSCATASASRSGS